MASWSGRLTPSPERSSSSTTAGVTCSAANASASARICATWAGSSKSTSASSGFRRGFRQDAVGQDQELATRVGHRRRPGLLHIGVPEGLGGAGAGLFELVLVAEEAGRRLAPVPLAETVAATRLLGACDAKELLGLAFEGARLVSLPPATGPVRTQVLADGAVADVVLGLVDERLVAFSRPTDARAISNMGSLPMARWSGATDVEVLSEGPGVAQAFSRALAEVRVLRAAALVGLAAEAIELGAAYARERCAFGIPIGAYQAVAHPLADALVAKDGAQLLAWKASWALETDHRDARVLARQAFVFAAELASHAAQHSLHIHGGYGFTKECDIQLYYRRSQAWAATVGDPGRELLALADGILPETVTEPDGGARGL